MKSISRKNWILIWILGMIGQICWNIENSWFNNFVYDKIAPEPAIVSWMVGVSAVVSTFCAFLVGTWGDRIGKRKPFICVGYVLWGLFTFLFGATEMIPKNPLFIAAAAVVLADAVMSFFGSVGNDGGFSPWTTDISNEQNRGKLGGALAVMPVFATIFGAVVSGILIEKLDFFAFFGLMGGIVAIVGILSLLTLKDSPALVPKRDEKGFWHQFLSVFHWKTVRENQELFWVFIVMTVYFIGFNVYFPYITIYFVNYLEYDYGMTGIIQGVGLLAASALTIPAARLIDRGKMAAVISGALACNTAGLMLVSFSQRLPILLIGVFGAGIGYILVLQTLTAWMKNLYPEEQRGQFEGIKQIFFVCIPMIAGPAIAAPVINHLGVEREVNGVLGMVPAPSLFFISALLTLLTLIPLIIAAKLSRKKSSKAF